MGDEQERRDEQASLLHGINKEAQPAAAPQSPAAGEEEMPHYWRAVVGWISFGLVWNILNTTVFATLYPKLLQQIDKNYVSDFSVANMLTTLLSSLLLPPLGSIADQMKQVKNWMVVCEFVGITMCFVFLPMIYIKSPTAQIVLAQVIYLLTLFFLRIAIMDNNALLSCFPMKGRITLSLVFNFIGFAVALLSLLALWLLTRGQTQPLNNEELVAIFAGVTLVLGLLTFLCPGDKRPPVGTPKQPITKMVKFAFTRLLNSFLAVKNDKQYRRVAWFLCAYTFFSTSGTCFTIYVVTFFVSTYNLSLNESSILNMYFMLSLVVGNVIGIVYKFKVNGYEEITLLIQNTLFIALFCVLFLTVRWGWGYLVALLISLACGLLYGWNTSLARGLMAKLTPDDKKGEFFGLYSTATYLGISFVSAAMMVMSAVELDTYYLCILLIIVGLPAYIFFFLLHRIGDPSTLAGAILENTFFNASKDGHLYALDLNADDPRWTTVEGSAAFADTAFMLAYPEGHCLYVITKENSMFRVDPHALSGGQGRALAGAEGEWGETVAATVLDGRMYTVSKAGVLLRNDFLTSGLGGVSEQIGGVEFAGVRHMVSARDSLYMIEPSGDLMRVSPVDGARERVGAAGTYRNTLAAGTADSVLYTVESPSAVFVTDLATGDRRQIMRHNK
eukprot:TRINITY_DN6271_c0_g1_i1.p1 TRINITY_DN6271_c0_g1~~TRINITY_DN6271_c0_g1_i1.p1  ORF type:complete len:673 (+),score=169.14 TRINITY_DN6271_c0_g1_i1:74-2092(+)